jgi:hypothetical protein
MYRDFRAAARLLFGEIPLSGADPHTARERRAEHASGVDGTGACATPPINNRDAREQTVKLWAQRYG